jgi:hypothetical protein
MVALPAVRYSLQGDRLCLEIPRGQLHLVQAEALKASAGYFQVELRKPGKPRTTGQGSQSHHINGHVAQIAQETGNDFDDVKNAAKHMALSRGYPYHTIAGQVVPYSETELNTEQAGHLIEALHQIAAELGIQLREV